MGIIPCGDAGSLCLNSKKTEYVCTYACPMDKYFSKPPSVVINYQVSIQLSPSRRGPAVYRFVTPQYPVRDIELFEIENCALGWDLTVSQLCSLCMTLACFLGTFSRSLIGPCSFPRQMMCA